MAYFRYTPSVFIRTTEERHKHHVSHVWKTLFNSDDIYLGSYSGEYCVGCEQFYAKRDLIDETHCPIHKQAVQTVEEETYLFRLEKYRLKLLDYYQSNPEAITPSHFHQSVIAQLQEGPLEDLSVSRINNKWGIQVPNDSQHTVYVWIDALFSYLTAMDQAGYKAAALSHTKHVIGKDILQFHAIYWPAFLLALDLPLPEQLIVHGWWTIEGHKISKSIPETTVHPSHFSDRLTNDGLRYALVRQKPLHRDGNLAVTELSEVINADLANNLANLVKRNHTLLLKHFSGQLDVDPETSFDTECWDLLKQSESQLKSVVHSYRSHDLYQVTIALQQVLTTLNSFFHSRAPWLINKGKDQQHVKNTCYLISNLLREIAFLYSPITPALSGRILSELGNAESSLITTQSVALKGVHITTANSHFQRV
nr:class I tRNA ligase family protein [Vibrio sonorensis]